MANAYNSQDLVKGILQRCGELTDGNSPYHALALRHLNAAYTDVLKGNSIFGPEIRECWLWAKKTGSFIYLRNYQSGDGTVSPIPGNCILTTGSTAGMFTLAPPISLQGYNFTITNQTNENTTSWYKIAQHTAGATSFTLDFQYVEESGTFAFNAVPLTVVIPQGMLRLADPLRQYNTRVLEFGELPQDMGRLYYMDLNTFWEKWPLELLLNDIPSRFTVESYSDSQYTLRFNKWVSNNMRVDFDYIPIVQDLTDTTDSIPLVPYEDRLVLEFAGAYYLATDKRQPADAENWLKQATIALQAMKLKNQGQQKLGKMFGQLVPRLDDTAIPYWLIQQR